MTITHHDVKWPQGFLPFYKQVQKLTEPILNGTLLAIDPSSGGTSLPGFAVFKAGELLTSGTLELGRKKLSIYDRLQLLYPAIVQLTDGPPSVLAIEMIRGQNFSSHYLHWAIGTTIAASQAPTIEVVQHAWKALAKVSPGYFKGDQQDAEKIGECLILLAQKFREERNAEVS